MGGRTWGPNEGGNSYQKLFRQLTGHLFEGDHPKGISIAERKLHKRKKNGGRGGKEKGMQSI